MRQLEYSDRKKQYGWFLKVMKLRKVKIQEFSRLAFVNTIISKRYLKQIVAEGIVDGWTDPRFPTVQAIIRRGLMLPTMVEFMLDQGPSRNVNFQEWDKIWGMNKKKMEKIAGKFNAVISLKRALVVVNDLPDTTVAKKVPVHPKNKELGETTQYFSNKFYINFDDALSMKNDGDEKFTLMNFMNVKVDQINEDGNGSFLINCTQLPEDKDFKSTKKISWVVGDDSLASKVVLVELEHLLTKAKLEKGDKLADFLNKDSRHTTFATASSAIKTLPIGSYIQFQRISNFRIDKRYIDKDGVTVTECILIPSGKSKGMSIIKTKVKAIDISKGGNI